MNDYRELLGYLAAGIGIIGYVPYFRDIFANKTKTHAFSWLVWAILTGIAFVIQVVEGAGPGAWVMGISTLACSCIFVLALFKGQKTFPLFDWVSLFAAFFSLLLWWITEDPTLSVILITVVDAVGYLPTFRKGFHKPYEETVTTYVLSTVKFIPAILALESYSIATWFYPASLLVMNGAFSLMLVIRRAYVRQTH